MKRVFKSNNIKDTEKLATKIANLLKGGEVLFLSGPIGAGKTIFVKSVCKALKIKETPISASFSLVKKYKNKNWTVYHIDLFRLKECEMYNLGLEEMLADEEAVFLVEWPKAGDKFFTKDRLNITIDLQTGDKRKIEIFAGGKKSIEVLKKLCQKK